MQKVKDQGYMTLKLLFVILLSFRMKTRKGFKLGLGLPNGVELLN